MFERRLKIFLAALLLMTLFLLGRAVQLQMVQGSYWTEQSVKFLRHPEETETTRGRILDYKDRPLAIEEACLNASVDYRAIVAKPFWKRTKTDNNDWMDKLAGQRLRKKLGKDYTSASVTRRKELRDDEIKLMLAQIDEMWELLARAYARTTDLAGDDDHPNRTPSEAIEEIKRGIEQKIEMRRRSIWYTRYVADKKKNQTDGEKRWWQGWLLGEAPGGPEIDTFELDELDEQRQPQVIVRNVDRDPQLYNELGKRLEECPGLYLQPGTRRSYPQGTAGCHLIGRLAKWSDKNNEFVRAAATDWSRRYDADDLIGVDGLESLCEPILRGSRGKVERDLNTGNILSVKEFKPGQDVRCTIDIELQREVQAMFKNVKMRIVDPPNEKFERHAMHGAAVVIDVPTGEVRVLASNPDFNLNQIDTKFSTWASDRLNNPMLNRATRQAIEPGSTVKPLVGLAGITDGVLGVDEGIRCDGYLYLDGKKVNGGGRCWTASQFSRSTDPAVLADIPDHQIPWQDKLSSPDKLVRYPDALERSCNVFFETVADRLKTERLVYWYQQFGFGKPTGIGILEHPGRLPGQHRGLPVNRMTSIFAGTGQGQVWATPLQIANEAATIARRGIWMRPHLLTTEVQASLNISNPTTQPVVDSVDLHLNQKGVAAAVEGMVLNANRIAGSGFHDVRRDLIGVNVAGKSGTAQASQIWITVTDADGKPLIDEKTHKEKRERLAPSLEDRPNPGFEWYRGRGTEGEWIDHAWYMGFAPAENPQIAFCVLIEYGGSGGRSAAPMVADILKACIEKGYLRQDTSITLINAGEHGPG